MATRTDLRALLDEARRVVVFTGAGISTESGIPDFRSPGGVWSRMRPINFQDFMASTAIRQKAWERVFAGRAGWTDRAPNEGHHAIARMVADGKVAAIITQNVDGLHVQSGVPASRVIELHGNATYAACLDCDARYEFADLRPAFERTREPPSCTRCGGVVKSATISFGQAMPEAAMERAAEETLACDLFLALGSSLVVYPAAGFPMLAKNAGARLAIVNREPTDLDDEADLVLHDELGPTLSEIWPATPN